MITVKYFASLREAAGCGEETLPDEGLRRVADVWQVARRRHDLPEQALCAVNQQHADAATPVRQGDEVAFFPQITGG